MDRHRVVEKLERLAKDGVCVSLSVGLLVLSQSPHGMGFIAPVALVPWLFRTRRASAVGAFAMGLMFGVAYSLLGANWIFDALSAQGSHGVRRIFAALLIALWAKGLLFAVSGWAVHRLRSSRTWIALLGPSILFALGELSMSESSWGLPLLLLGHSQISVPGVAQLAVAVGVPGISTLLFVLNLALVSTLLAEKGGRRGLRAVGSMWLVAMVTGLPIAQFLTPEIPSEGKRLLVVQPDVFQHHRLETSHQEILLDELVVETTLALAERSGRPDVILWPESLFTLSIAPEDHLGRRLQGHIDDWSVPVVAGFVRAGEGGRFDLYRNSVGWWSPSRGLVDIQDKARAIPVVESSRTFWGQTLFVWAIGNAAEGSRVAEAVLAEPLKGDFTLSPALCFEILFPGIVSDRRDEESVAIVNLADDSWVAGEVLDAQIVAAAAFRAIEQRLTMVRVSHGGLSVAIDRFGSEIASLPPNRFAHMLVEAEATPRPSMIEKIGALLLPLMTGLVMLGGWKSTAVGLRDSLKSARTDGAIHSARK